MVLLEQYRILVNYMSKSKSRYERRKPERKEKNEIVIVCCGQTEKEYFKKYNIDIGSIRIVPIMDNTSPIGNVNRAIAEKNKRKPLQCWCVFDKDNFNEFDEAIDIAKKNGINVAFSNQAFELWFILHKTFLCRQVHRNEYHKMLEKSVFEKCSKMKKPYKKAYELLVNDIPEAIINAKKGHQIKKVKGGRPSSWESCTTVYMLAEELEKRK